MHPARIEVDETRQYMILWADIITANPNTCGYLCCNAARYTTAAYGPKSWSFLPISFTISSAGAPQSLSGYKFARTTIVASFAGL